MSDSISATCTCGAEFGANSTKAHILWREWKRDHGCKTLIDQHTTLDASIELADEDEPEFSIGFRYQPDEE